MRSLIAVALIAGTLVIASCGRRRAARPPAVPAAGSVEEGIASWYGPPYHGRAAANGEIYDMEKLTAAHRTLPFGTWVRVENLVNGRHVTVRINDRGPFVDGRIIDLSKAAARSIAMIGPGTARVRVVVTTQPVGYVPDDLFEVQAGAFRDEQRARDGAAELRRFGPTRLVRRDGDPPVWRILVGGPLSIDEANDLARRIRETRQSAFVVCAGQERD